MPVLEDASAFARGLEALEALAEDARLLAGLSEDERARLMRAAGRLARPTALERSRLRKAMRLRARESRRAEDKRTREEARIRKARAAPVYQAPARETPPAAPARHLKKARFCYVCKTPYTSLHFFYDSMCQACGDFNYEKRFQTADLSGRKALVTGARLKIGYQASLMLLRAGASVIATTRFPQDAAARYSREPDFAAWKGRLSVHGLDLRHSPSVELFARRIAQTESRLDILINNAAQTVRRPAAFYEHLREIESLEPRELPGGAGELLAGPVERKALLAAGAGGDAETESQPRSRLEPLGALAPAALFPDGRLDADLQQLDLRAVNSWRLRLAEVSTRELLEVQLVNAVAPFILCGKLKALMLRHANGEQHVVNASAMEGVFSRHTKTDKHPHTNMAKAALNMLTLTSAPDYHAGGIQMNAVDTGWVTDEDPARHCERKREQLDFQPPLDIVDGAARLCDPVFSGLRTGRHVWGKFLKDYKPSPW